MALLQTCSQDRSLCSLLFPCAAAFQPHRTCRSNLFHHLYLNSNYKFSSGGWGRRVLQLTLGFGRPLLGLLRWRTQPSLLPILTLFLIFLLKRHQNNPLKQNFCQAIFTNVCLNNLNIFHFLNCFIFRI